MSEGSPPSAPSNRAKFDYLQIKSDGSEGNIWLTIYSDMMTNFMLFFLMMFALNLTGKSNMEKAEEAFKKTVSGEVTPEVKTDSPKHKTETLNDFFRKFAEEQKDVQIIKQGEGVRLRLPEPVLFDPAKADLKDEARSILHEIAVGLTNLPHTLVVEGHTDNLPLKSGAYASNWELSEARAESVLNYLVQEEGISPQRMAVAGFGEYWPFVPNDSTFNRALNRRIELLVVTEGQKDE